MVKELPTPQSLAYTVAKCSMFALILSIISTTGLSIEIISNRPVSFDNPSRTPALCSKPLCKFSLRKPYE
jgi:hypothetical protein